MTVNVDWRAICFCALWALCRETPAAAACACNPPETPEAALSGADAVFEGIAQVVEDGPDGGQRVSFGVVRAFKGVDSEVIALGAAAGRPACRVRFVQGEGYLVYAAATPAGLVARPCMRTQPTAEAEADLTALGPGEVPVDPAKPVPPAILASDPPSAGPKGAAGGCAGCRLDGTTDHGSAGLLGAGMLLSWLGLRRRR